MREYIITILVFLCIKIANADNPYRFYNWKITYGDIYPLGVKQQVNFLFFLNLFWDCL